MEVHDIIKEYAKKYSRIVFNGNGYCDEWVVEAKKEACQTKIHGGCNRNLVTPKAINMFEKFGVFSEKELHSRVEVKYEAYAKAINIEARAMIDVASKQLFRQ